MECWRAVGMWFWCLLAAGPLLLLVVEAVPLSSNPRVTDLNIDLLKQPAVKILLPNDEYMDYRGSAMSLLSDLDNNGMADLAVGAYADDTITNDAGAVYILYLQANQSQPFLHYTKITSGRGGFQFRLEEEDYFGCSVAGISDVNGDGVPDMVVGALGDGDAGANAGAVYLLFLQRNNIVTPVWDAIKITQNQGGFTAPLKKNDFFGSSVCSLGDLDGNGVGDMAVGAYGEAGIAGAVYILYLQNSRSRPVKAHYKIEQNTPGFEFGLMPNDAFGVSVTQVDDIDGDGVDDMVIGAYMDSTAETSAGAVYILLMRTIGNDAQLNTVSPIRTTIKVTSGMANFTDHLIPKAYFGAAVTGTEDLDNDGVPELVVSALGDVQANPMAGAVYVLFLKRNAPNGPPTVKKIRKITTGVQGFKPQLDPEQMFGASVVELPDLDGDNVTELAIGSYMDQGAPIYLLYKNSLAPITIQSPKIFNITPSILSTVGGDLVTMYISLDVVVFNMSLPLEVMVTIGEEQCLVMGNPLQDYTGNRFPGQIPSADQRPFLLTCTSPPGVGAKLPVAVIIRQGDVEMELTYTQTLSYHVPVVTSVTPSHTWGKGGFDITVNGLAFGAKDHKPMVLVNSNPCASTLFVSDANVICVGAPPGLGEAVVQVSVMGQMSTASKADGGQITFRYDYPVITGWNISDPMTVLLPIYNDYRVPLVYSPYTGGEEILQIWGSNFGPPGSKAMVWLGNKECTKARVQADDHLTCITPSGVGSNHVINVTLAGIDLTYSYFAYGAPLLLTIIPDSGSPDGGDMVIMGRNFGPGIEPHDVQIGDSHCQNIKVVYDYQLITCKYPAGSGKELKLVVTVANQTNLPQMYGYTDVYGQKTVMVSFVLEGESMATMSPSKVEAFEETLSNTLDLETAINIHEGSVHVTRIEPVAAKPDSATSRNAVVLYTDIAASNIKVAEELVAWVKNVDKMRLATDNLAHAKINIQGLVGESMAISDEIYCSPGQQPQFVSDTEKACFLCPINTFQPRRSKGPCLKCPLGANCTNEGEISPYPLPGYWRSKLEHIDEDPLFVYHPIYPCEPAEVCLGGSDSQCAEGHVQGSPLCSVCERHWYTVAGDCQQCGPRHNLLITIYFASTVTTIGFFILLYIWVRPGADIDEAADELREKLLDDGPNAASFHAAFTMRNFLTNAVSRHLATRLDTLTHLPDVWSKAKISVTFLQIMASLNVAYKVPWPPGFKKVLDQISVLNFNVLNLPGLSFSCVADVDFFSEFLLAIIAPIILTIIFLLTYFMGRKVIKRKVSLNSQVVKSLQEQAMVLKKQLSLKLKSMSFKKSKKRANKSHSTSPGSPSKNIGSSSPQKGQTSTTDSATSSPLINTPPVSPPFSPDMSTPPASSFPTHDRESVTGQDAGGAQPMQEDIQEKDSGRDMPTIANDGEDQGERSSYESEDEADEQTLSEADSPQKQSPTDNVVSPQATTSQPIPTPRMAIIDMFSPRPSSTSMSTVTNSTSSSSPSITSPSTKRHTRKTTFKDESTEIVVPGIRKQDSQQASGDLLSENETVLELKHKVAVLEKQEDLEKFSIEQYQARLITLWFWIILLIYPSVSRVVLEAINCRTLDHNQRLLVVDYNISCDSAYYRNYLILIGPALILYPFGIPVMFFIMLLYKRNVHPWDDNLSFLYKSYKPQYWWFEVYELFRKLILTGLIIFVANGTATQLAIACILCMVSICIHFRMSPYEETFDDLLQSFSLAELLTMTYCALLLKLDLTGSDHTSVVIFDYVLLVSNAVVVLGIMPASFFLKSRQWFDRMLNAGLPTLASQMKKEAFNRMAIAVSLILAVWSSIANSVTDHLTRACTVVGLIQFVLALLQTFYFVPQVQIHIPERYRILSVLDPINCLTGEEEEELPFDKVVPKGKSSSRDLTARSHSSRSMRRLNSRKLSRSGMGIKEDRPYMVRHQQSLEATLSYNMSSVTDFDSPGGGKGWLLTRLFYTGWLLLITKRRALDSVTGVTNYVLILILLDYGVGSTNYARMVMLGVAVFFTLVILAFPHVQDRAPPLVSPLRLAQVLLALSTIVAVVVEVADEWSGSSIGLLVEVAALVVSALTVLHALAGVTRGLTKFWRFNIQGAGNMRHKNLRRADSVYGSLMVNRGYMDSALLLAMVVVVIGMFLSQERPQSIGPMGMILAQAALFLYKPLRAAQQYHNQWLSQLYLIKSLFFALRDESHQKSTQNEDDDYVQDEKDLGSTQKPQALAAEVIRLRRKLQELESEK